MADGVILGRAWIVLEDVRQVRILCPHLGGVIWHPRQEYIRHSALSDAMSPISTAIIKRETLGLGGLLYNVIHKAVVSPTTELHHSPIDLIKRASLNVDTAQLIVKIDCGWIPPMTCKDARQVGECGLRI